MGFLKTLTNQAIGTNAGYDGDTTVSFVAQGGWANIIDAVNRTKEYYAPYVTIQVKSFPQPSHKGERVLTQCLVWP